MLGLVVGTLFCLLRVEIVLHNFDIVCVQSDVCPTMSCINFLFGGYNAVVVVDNGNYNEENTLDLVVHCFPVYARSF